jgi:Uma2 family endonuclease
MQLNKIRRRPGETMTTTPVQAPQVARETRKFTVDEYFRMVEAGVLQEDEKVELIEGEILLMPPMGSDHIWGVSQYAHTFISRAASRFTVQIQSTLRLGENFAPEPDLAVLKFREDRYYLSPPNPSDVLLIIEVADSSLAYDRDVKAHIYGRAPVPETWVLNLPGDCLERFTEPGPEGYAQHTVLRRGDKVRPVSLPDMELAVEDLLPPVVATQEE